MRKMTVSVQVDAEKLRAIQFYAGRKDSTVEAELEMLRSIPKSGCFLLPKMPVADLCSSRPTLRNSILLKDSGLG